MSGPCPVDINCNGTDFFPAPNSDIAGFGVVIGFIGTAYLVFFLLLIYYFGVYKPDNRPPSRRGIVPQNIPNDTSTTNTSLDWTPNPVDALVLNLVRRTTSLVLRCCRVPPLVIGHETSVRVEDCFNKSILGMCDIQVVTGISILVSGFISVDETLSAHHWEVIAYIAWFSCMTHLSGLVILRDYLQPRLLEKYTRMFFMLVLVVMLNVAMLPTIFFNWRMPGEDGSTMGGTAAYPGSPVICFFSVPCGSSIYNSNRPIGQAGGDVPLIRSAACQQAIISSVSLVVGFLSRASKLSLRFSHVFHRRCVLPMHRFIVAWVEKLQMAFQPVGDCSPLSRIIYEAWVVLVARPILAIIIFSQPQICMLNSVIWELLWLLALLLWGTAKLKSALSLPLNNPNHEAQPNGDVQVKTELDEPRWQFGQVLSVLLLAAPLASMFGIFASGVTSRGLGIASNSYNTCDCSRNETIVAVALKGFQLPDEMPTGERSFQPCRSAFRIEQHRGRNPENGIAAGTIETPETTSSTVVFEALNKKTMLILPCLASSFMVLVGHTCSLFLYATDMFNPKDWGMRVGTWTPIDYLFNIKGVFYLAALSYLSAGVSIILFGMVVDSRQLNVDGLKSRYIQELLWLFAVSIHGLYGWIIYSPAPRSPSERIWIICCITSGLFAVYVVACFALRLYRKRIRQMDDSA